MKFCQECGERLEFLGLSEWSTGVWLYGCSRCDTLWEAHGCSISGRIDSYEKGTWKLSEWKRENKK